MEERPSVTSDLRPAPLLVRTAVLGFLAAAIAGCGGERLYNVSGTATYDDKPIPAGIIYFDPDPMKGGNGRQGFANIIDGKYTTAENGRGVAPGAYIIRITGYDGKTANEAPLGRALFNEVQLKEEIPAQDTDLPLSIPRKRG
jgi:hypothetical protein